MASVIYNEFKAKISTIDWGDNAGVDIKVALVNSSYAPDIDNDLNFSDVTNEITGTGYVAGGTALLNRAISKDLTNDWGKYDADDAVWANSTLTARGAVVYLDTGTPATSTLIAYIDFVADKSSSSGDFIIQWHTDGVFRIG